MHMPHLLYSFTACYKILPSKGLSSQLGLLAASLLQMGILQNGPKGLWEVQAEKGSEEELSVQTVFSERCWTGSSGEQSTLCICSSGLHTGQVVSSSPGTHCVLASCAIL